VTLVYAPPFSRRGYIISDSNIDQYVSYVQAYLIAIIIFVVAYIIYRKLTIPILLASMFIAVNLFLFYRNFLSKGDREIPLEKEVTIVKDYLSLQKLRYGDILIDEYDIAAEAADCIVPKLTLQPLVENCIYHGIRPKGEPGVIRIKAAVEGDDLHIYVTDTGVGMSSEYIDKLMSGKKNASGDEGSFGLWGTIERIRYYSHRDDVFRITSEEGEYTCIELIIPAIKGVLVREEKPDV